MFTLLEPRFPEYTGDPEESYRNLKAALKEWFGSFNQPGAIFPSENYSPLLSFGGGSTGITYTRNTGRFLELGDFILATGIITLSAKGSSTGAAKISLPATVRNDADSYAAASLHLSDVVFTGTAQAYADINTTSLVLTTAAAAGGAYAALDEGDFTNTSEILFTVMYPR